MIYGFIDFDNATSQFEEGFRGLNVFEIQVGVIECEIDKTFKAECSSFSCL
jgi:hypothetical protein